MTCATEKANVAAKTAQWCKSNEHKDMHVLSKYPSRGKAR